MGIVEQHIKTAVNKNKFEMYYVTNTRKEDFSFPWNTNDVDEKGKTLPPSIITLPAGEPMTLPSEIAFHAVIKLAKQILYEANSRMKLQPANWLPIAETLIRSVKEQVVKEPKKTEGQKLKEQLEKLNPKEGENEKVDLIDLLEAKGFKSSVKNDKENKTYSKASGVKSLQELLK